MNKMLATLWTHRTWKGRTALVAGVLVAGLAASAGAGPVDEAAAPVTTVAAEVAEGPPTTEAPTTTATPTSTNRAAASTTTGARFTRAEENANRSAESYLDLIAEDASRAVEPHLSSRPMWGSSDTDLRVGQMELLSEQGGVDVVFLGSSIVAAAIDPDRFAARSEWATSAYNASLAAASPRVLEPWATEVVFPLLEPRVVVVGLSSRALNDNGINQNAAYNRYIQSDGRARYLSTTTVSDEIEWAVEDKPSTITDLGHQTLRSSKKYRISKRFGSRLTERVLNDYTIGDAELAALDAIIEAALASGADVYVIDMPVFEADYIGLHPRGEADHDAYEAAFDLLADDDRLVAASARHVVTQQRFFADPLHLNGTGAERLSNWIAKLVVQP